MLAIAMQKDRVSIFQVARLPPDPGKPLLLRRSRPTLVMLQPRDTLEAVVALLALPLPVKAPCWSPPATRPKANPRFSKKKVACAWVRGCISCVRLILSTSPPAVQQPVKLKSTTSPLVSCPLSLVSQHSPVCRQTRPISLAQCPTWLASTHFHPHLTILS
jgi:hypothetical protein